MKKLLSLALVMVMVLSAFAALAVSSSAAETISMTLFGTGMENWSDQTQLLLSAKDENWTAMKAEVDSKWELTFDDGTTQKVVKLTPSSDYDGGDWGILRFEVCLGKGENQFVPVKDTGYAVTGKVYNADGTLKLQANPPTNEDGSVKKHTLTVDPIVPAPVSGPVTVAVTPMFGYVENWEGGTWFIAGVGTASDADLYAGLKDGSLSLKVVITDTTDNKTYTISKYAFDIPNKEFYITAGMKFLRIAVCQYGIVPVNGHAYTVAVEATDANGEVQYTGTSDAGAFNKFNDAFVADGPITVADEDIQHWYDEKEPVTPPTPATVKDVVVYYPKDSVAMTATATGTKLTGVAATKDGNKLVVDDNTYVVLTMTTEADGTFTLQNAAGEYLTSGATGNGISFAAEKTDLAVWVMDGIFIKNTTAAYNNNPQYLEYYSGFTTYGKSATANEEAYTFELIDAANVSVKGVTPPPQPPVAGDATVIIAVVAIVALFGTAVVVTKKVTER